MGRIYKMRTVASSVGMGVRQQAAAHVANHVAVCTAACAVVVLASGCFSSRQGPQTRVEPIPAAAIDSLFGRTASVAEVRAQLASPLLGDAANGGRPVGTATSPVGDSVNAGRVAGNATMLSSQVDSAPRSDAAVIAALDSGPAAAPPIAWDLEVEVNASRSRVAYFADVFTGRARPAFELALSRQTRFAPLISEKLRAGGLPLDLTYLALIESWYNPDAYSKAAAVGMWQFMAGTARGVGLRVDWWIDERRDPVRSTEGAVRLLSSLHDDFGSFFLAAAAYNGGSGRVSRGLTQFATRIEPFTGEDRFFALSDTRSLRPETRDYVPKMIAAALVAKQPERYGLHIESMAPFAFDSVLAPSGAPLAAIASAAPTGVSAITDLNPHILRGMVPVGAAVWVRVPKGSGAGFDERYAALDSSDRASHKRVVSKAGESMSSIARKNKLTAKQLNWFNPKVSRLKSGNLVAGQRIVVPTAAVAAAARDVPNPSIEKYPRRRAAPPTKTAAAGKSKASAATRGLDAKMTTKVPVTKAPASKAPAPKTAKGSAMQPVAPGAKKPN